jgi:hypothetical protein
MENEEVKEEKKTEEKIEPSVPKTDNIVDGAIEKEVKIDFYNEDVKEKPKTENIEDILNKDAPKKAPIAKKIDLSKIELSTKNELEKERDLKAALYGNKAAYQIVAAQSGYMAKVIPLVNKDVINLLYTSLSRYEYKKAVFSVIWSKIYDTSVGKMDFDTWLKCTSVEDIETFYYGVYCATFPDEGTFRVECPKCGEETECKVNKSNLFKTTDKEAMKVLMDKVSREATSKEAMVKFSLLGKTEAYQLTDSKIVFELRTPSLWDSLEILRTVPENVIDKDIGSVTNMLYINRVLIPTKDSKAVYNEQNDRQEILRIIDNLTIDDAAELQKIISDRVDENRITYSIKNVKCSNCGEEIKDVPIHIEDVLFPLIYEKAQ